MMKNIKHFDPYAILKDREQNPEYRETLEFKRKCLETEPLINEFYTDIAIIFLNTWGKPATQEEINAYKKQLLFAIVENNVTSTKNLERALKEARAYPIDEKTKFPAISQLIGWMSLSLQERGFKSLDDAFEEACTLSHPSHTQKVFSHPVIEYAWRETGSSSLLNRTKSNEGGIKKRFEYFYLMACRLFENNELHCSAPKGLEHESKTGIAIGKGFEKLTTAKSAIEKMREMLR